MRFIAVLASLLCGFSGNSVFADELSQQFADEATRAWTDLRVGYRNLRGTVVARQESMKKPNSISWEETLEFNGNDENRRFTLKTNDGFEKIVGANAEYGFEITRSTPQSALTVKYVGPEPEKAIDRMERYPSLSLGLQLDMFTVDWLVGHPSFKVTSTSTHNGEVEVLFTSNANYRPDYQVRGGRLVFDPESSWALKDYEVKVKFHDGIGLVMGAVTYGSPVDGLPIPATHIVDFKDESGKTHYSRKTFRFEGISPGDVTESQVTMSAFGLPEPIDIEPNSPSRLWIFLAAVGLLCLFLGIFIRRRAYAAA